MGDGRRKTRPWPSWELLGIIAFTAWIAWPFVAPGGYVTDFDTVAYSGPNLEATYRAWGDGRMPWWEPGAFGGTAFSTNLQTAVFYPLKVVFWPLGAPAAMGAMTATHLFLLAFGMRHLARRTLSLPAPAGLVAAVVMVGAGSTMVRSVRFEQIAVMAWIPWLLVALDAAMVARPERRARAVAATAAVTALVLLSGHPHQAYLGLALAVPWILGRLFEHRRAAGSPDGAARMLVRVGGGMALGVGVAAVALVTALPLLGGGAVPTSALLEQASLDRYVLEPLHTAPRFFGDPWSSSGVLSYPTGEAPIFLGVAAIALAVVGVTVALSRAERPSPPLRATATALLVAGTGSLLLAFGPPARFYGWAAAVVPGLGQGRVPLRWLFITTFVVALFAAVGAAALRDHLPVRQKRVAASIGVGLAIVAVAALVPTGIDPRGVTRLTWLIGIAIVAGAVVVAARRPDDHLARNALGAAAVAFVILELGIPAATSYGRELRRAESFVTSSTDSVSSFLVAQGDRYLTVGGSDANTSLTTGSRSLDGYDGGLWLTDSYVAGARQVVKAPFRPLDRIGEQVRLPLEADALARLGVRYVVIDPREHAARTVRRAPNDAEVALARQQIAPGWTGPAVVEGNREVWENPRFRGEAMLYAGATTGEGVAAATSRPSAGAIDVTTADSDAGGRLVIAEQGQAGWVARVDGAPAELRQVDGFAIAVDVPPGAHRIELRYQPPRLALGLALSAISIAVVLALALAGGRRTPRRAGPPG